MQPEEFTLQDLAKAADQEARVMENDISDMPDDLKGLSCLARSAQICLLDGGEVHFMTGGKTRMIVRA